MAYTPEEREIIVNQVSLQVAEGQSLIDVLAKSDDLPCRDTFDNWLLADEILFGKYTRARVLRCEREFERILLIADNSSKDYFIDEETGKLKVDHENIQRSRLRVDVRKWWLSKVVPKIYGDKVHLSLDPPITNPNGFDISLLQADTLTLITRDLEAAKNNKTLTSAAIKSGDVQDVEEVE